MHDLTRKLEEWELEDMKDYYNWAVLEYTDSGGLVYSHSVGMNCHCVSGQRVSDYLDYQSL